ncbi:MAG: long-chain fatty acid--CoA ligase [Bacillota bacterium]
MTMRHNLTLHTMLERARRYFPHKEIVSRTGPGSVFRYTYADYYARTKKLASALAKLGVGRGDRVGTIAWNHHRHLEAYFAVPCMGASLHTINLRLPPEHLAYVINHGGDKVLLIDADLLPLVEAIQGEIETVEHYVVMGDGPLPQTRLAPVHSYEELLAEAPAGYEFPEDIDEWAEAGMCFSSATTGMPKGVTYAHRAIYLHSMVVCMTDTIAIAEKDVVLPVVPMFHVNAWGLPFASTWMGAKQVLPGPRPDPHTLCQLMQEEKVTLAAGVPTVWMGVLQAMEQKEYDLSSITRVACGGSAPPRALIEAYEQKLGVPFLHAYGMTEAAPVTHVSRLKSNLEDAPAGERYAKKAKQGLLVPGLDMVVLKEDGSEVAWNGQEMGEVVLRGPWIASEYYNDERSKATFKGGWYHTGDVATVDGDGYMQIIDRVKDLVKSGGEWISSVDLENAIMAHPKVAEAAVVAVHHPKWQERPLACVVPRAGVELTAEEIKLFLKGRFADWWIPDDVVFISEVPKTSVGKFDKKVLREKYWNHLSAEQAPAD